MIKRLLLFFRLARQGSTVESLNDEHQSEMTRQEFVSAYLAQLPSCEEILNGWRDVTSYQDWAEQALVNTEACPEKTSCELKTKDYK